MLSVEKVDELVPYADTVLGVSDWIDIDQEMISAFARVTQDTQWIHVDVERAGRELPRGKTIAHGYLILSLIPRMLNVIYEVRSKSRTINYGLNKVRFLSSVGPGDRIRMTCFLKEIIEIEGGKRIVFENAIERKGGDRPVLVAECIVAIYR